VRRRCGLLSDYFIVVVIIAIATVAFNAAGRQEEHPVGKKTE